MPKGSGKPKYAKPPKESLVPKLGGIRPESSGDVSLIWRLAHLDLDGKWGWHKLVRAHVADLHKIFVAAETTPIHELMKNKRLKKIPVKHICGEAKRRLKDLDHDDADDIWEFRDLKEKRRAWGFLVKDNFYVLWWDPNHSVCPDGPPKGTRRG